jgi:hypothetical protein
MSTKMYENEVNSSLKKKKEKQNPSSSAIVNFFDVKELFKKDHM